MKTSYLFFLIFTIYLQTNGQINCADVNSSVVYGYSHIKTASEANNLKQVKLWAKRSLESFNKVKGKLDACLCEESYLNMDNIVEMLYKVENSNNLQNGKGYSERAREIVKDVIHELELCSNSEKYSSR